MSGQNPPPTTSYYPPPGAPVTSYQTSGQYPVPHPVDSYGYYPPPQAPSGTHPPPGAAGGYPPGGFPMAQYPGAPMPPSGQYPGAPVPPGPYPQPGYYPPPGAQAGGMYPVLPSKPDSESEDSDPHEFGLRSREDKNPLSVKFFNRSGKKVTLFWLDKKGRHKKIRKLKEGKSTMVETFETHAFMCAKKRGDPLMIDGNVIYFARQRFGSYGKQIEVDICKLPDSLKSPSGYQRPQVAVKFVNRTKRKVHIHWINDRGHEEEKKTIGAGRCWRTLSFEGDCWVANDKHDELLLNYGEFYKVPSLPAAASAPGYKERVIITEGVWDSSSSSSSSTTTTTSSSSSSDSDSVKGKYKK